MRTVPIAFLAIFTSLFLTSCAVDMDSKALWDGLRDSKVQLHAAGRAELTKPLRLGVVPPLRTTEHGWRDAEQRLSVWTEEEREIVQRWARRFEERGVVEEVVFLPRLLLGSDADDKLIPTLRAVATAAGVDAVLITHSLTDTAHQPNVLALFDITIVGAFVVPGHHWRALTVAEGVVLDPHRNLVYAFAEGQGEATSWGPYAYEDCEELAQAARVDSLDKLGEALFESVQSSVWRAQGFKPQRIQASARREE